MSNTTDRVIQIGKGFLLKYLLSVARDLSVLIIGVMKLMIHVLAPLVQALSSNIVLYGDE